LAQRVLALPQQTRMPTGGRKNRAAWCANNHVKSLVETAGGRAWCGHLGRWCFFLQSRPTGESAKSG